MNLQIANSLCLCALLVLTAGCAAGPDYARPEADTADTWSESTDSGLSADPADYGSWWGVFKDPILDELVQIASVDNLSLQIATVRILEARARLGFARGLRLPQQQQVSGQAAKVGLSQNAPNVAIADYKALGGGWEIRAGRTILKAIGRS